MSRPTSPTHFARRLSFECLEDRRVLATFTVTNLSEAPVSFPGAAPGTLRQAIYDANNTPGPDMIEFAANLSGALDLLIVDDTSLGASALIVSSPITIHGNANGVTIRRSSAAAEMRLFHVTTTGDLTLDSISLTGGIMRGANGASTFDFGAQGLGGAIYNQGSLAVIASTIYNNQAIGGNGGAMGIGGSGRGGAIYNEGGTLTITNSTFSGNSVHSGTGTQTPSSFGGAIYTKNGTLTVRNSTITNSTASTGRGIYVSAEAGTATIDIWSSIIGQSDLLLQAREFLTSLQIGGQLVVTGGNNLIRSQGDYQSITVSTDNPLLGPLANNGGPTMTHALLEGSPAINFGSNTQSLATDQRGAPYSRVVGSTADIGAFETQTVSGPALSGDFNGNQTVDAADYIVWRQSRGTTVTPFSGADGNGDGAIDTFDIAIWRAHFGATLSSGAAAATSVATASDTIVDHEVTDDQAPAAPSVSISMPTELSLESGRTFVEHGPILLDESINKSELALIALCDLEPSSHITTPQAPNRSRHSAAPDSADSGYILCDTILADWPQSKSIVL
ncbi:MAG TPA: choice-of-anchor Q domain-containing protein [Lacipirellulaceae bacterium]|jgi:hypothetical protein|nr:choice-of-anchor Q domain-containing protein [Lacipirellulaceae bacterium]